jgi:uncharacterized protein
MADDERPRWPSLDVDTQALVIHPIAEPQPARVEVLSASTVPRTAPRSQRRPWRGWLGAIAIMLAGVLAMLAVPGVETLVEGLNAIDGTPVAAPAPGTAPQGGPGGPGSPPSAPPSTSPEQQPVYRLADHPLLVPGVKVVDTPCKLPVFRRDTAGLRAYYTALIGCLDAAWRPVLIDGQMPHRTPPSNLAEHPGQTGCGNPDEGEGGEFTALYCPADETLYLPVDRLKAVDRGGPSSHLAVLAHEYGHHVQQLSGLLGAAADERDKAGEDTPAGQEVTRRIELQANCFAGLFLAAVATHGSISRSLASQAVADFRNGGLPDTHGSRTHQATWASRGYQQRTTAACNTWSAPAKDVT